MSFIYNCYYNNRVIEVIADTSLKAKELGVAQFNPPKSKQHMVHVVLASGLDGKPREVKTSEL